MKRFVLKLKKLEAFLHKRLVCLQPTIQRRLGRMKYPEGMQVTPFEDLQALKEKKRQIKKEFAKVIFPPSGPIDYEDYVEDGKTISYTSSTFIFLIYLWILSKTKSYT